MSDDKKFIVIDIKTGEEADTCGIAKNEDWAKDLMWMDMEGFAVEEDGTLILLDECGSFQYCPSDRFVIKDEQAEAALNAEREGREKAEAVLRKIKHDISWLKYGSVELSFKDFADSIKKAESRVDDYFAGKDKAIEHGVSCEKVPHKGRGYLHLSDNDTPYHAGDSFYCGRCHVWIEKDNADENRKAD